MDTSYNAASGESQYKFLAESLPGGIMAPVARLAHGPLGAPVPVDTAHPMPVTDPLGATATGQQAIITALNTVATALSPLATAAAQAAITSALQALLSQTDGVEGSLVSILAKLSADPSTATAQAAEIDKLTSIDNKLPGLSGSRVPAESDDRVLASLIDDSINEAIANDWATSNPASHVKMPANRVKRKRLSFETWQQMRELAKASRQRWLESLLLLSLTTGQRRGDLAKMRFNDVVDGHLQVEQQKQAGKGYGARIAIPLSLRLEAIGMTLGDVIEHCRHSAAPGPTLLRKAGGDPLEESSLSIRFAECIRAVRGENAYSTDEWPSLHEVRSLAARMYRAQGVDVQTLLGHKHAEMTAMYEDDRGLKAGHWKRLAVATDPH